MSQNSGSQPFDVRYEDSGDLPVFVDHFLANTIENGIYLAMATNLPIRDPKAEQVASVHATLYLPLDAVSALHALAENFRLHVGGGTAAFSQEAVALRFDRPRSDVPVLADFFNCKGVPNGVHLSVGRMSTSTPNLAVVFATYQLSNATMLKLHWLTTQIMGLVRPPPGYPTGSHSSH
ncbi:hypothetical protein [Methylorubrum extorquens]|uniref:Uncharacterized protein n=1 Tax=Methylorubrum extorquens (strain ATCC 14718 / DSM 1338 / JCM 2805 / NCIMB 9133 / AM1) TaxID=272630 RepID=C5B3D2_METEA|nr:hypothetical protein [Methylorubrum extorquens]ACS42964.1 Hypothetical protein MexAM1_META2p0026 [Methylorubrum extorquens AM1]MCP1545998.1 hypothetical protein [Methylorubrum extorquens]MCP1590665.1 hypothetical protein [Methylorubrum extorquens]